MYGRGPSPRNRVHEKTNSGFERGQRFEVQDLRTAGNYYSRAGEVEPEARPRQLQWKETNQNVRYVLIYHLLIL